MTQRISAKTASNGLLGALAIAAGTNAYGQGVVSTPPADLTNVSMGANTTVSWDVNNDGIIDFTFRNRYPDTDPTAGNGVIWQMAMLPAAGTSATNGLISYAGPFVRYASALKSGNSVGPAAGTAFSTTTVVLGSRYASGGAATYYGGFAAGNASGTGPNGSVSPGTFAFVGFRFNAADGTHYGWLRLSISAGLIDFDTAAYNATPGAPILAGSNTAVPEPSTLAFLALGAVAAVGAAVKRRRA